MNFFRRTPRAVGAPEFLIVGLGNPGKEYEFTRHNAGFLCLDLFAQENDIKINRLKFNALIGDAEIGGKRCILAKPQTFMNNSGEAAAEAARFYKIPPEHVIVAENNGVQTDFRRLDEHALSSWLEAFSLGELWEKNLLGGRP